MKNNHLPRTILQKPVIIACLFLAASVVVTDMVYSEKAASATPSKRTASTSPSLPLLVDVGADKCVPCVMMAPILEKLKKEYAGILHVKFVDAWKNPEEARKYGIRAIPTQIFYDASGKELGRHMGFISKEGILTRFEELGVRIQKPQNK